MTSPTNGLPEDRRMWDDDARMRAWVFDGITSVKNGIGTVVQKIAGWLNPTTQATNDVTAATLDNSKSAASTPLMANVTAEAVNPDSDKTDTVAKKALENA